jgi:hypothetical protein
MNSENQNSLVNFSLQQNGQGDSLIDENDS